MTVAAPETTWLNDRCTFLSPRVYPGVALRCNHACCCVATSVGAAAQFENQNDKRSADAPGSPRAAKKQCGPNDAEPEPAASQPQWLRKQVERRVKQARVSPQLCPLRIKGKPGAMHFRDVNPDGTIKVGDQDQEWDVKKTDLTRYLPRELQPDRPVHMFERARGLMDKPKIFTGEKPQDQMTAYAKDHDHKCFAAFNHLIAKWEWTDNQDSDVSFDAGRFVEVAVNAYCSFPDVKAMDNFLARNDAPAHVGVWRAGCAKVSRVRRLQTLLS